jgi:hypothetical protein
MLSDVPMVRAGDTLIVCVSASMTVKDAEIFTESIQRGMPGVRVAFMENVTGLAVFRPELSRDDESCGDSTTGAMGA